MLKDAYSNKCALPYYHSTLFAAADDKPRVYCLETMNLKGNQIKNKECSQSSISITDPSHRFTVSGGDFLADANHWPTSCLQHPDMVLWYVSSVNAEVPFYLMDRGNIGLLQWLPTCLVWYISTNSQPKHHFINTTCQVPNLFELTLNIQLVIIVHLELFIFTVCFLLR